MTYCKNENCNHHSKRLKHCGIGTSYVLLGLCSCCARESYPTGFEDAPGHRVFFGNSNMCNRLNKLEFEESEDKIRKAKAKQKLTIVVKSFPGDNKEWF